MGEALEVIVVTTYQRRGRPLLVLWGEPRKLVQFVQSCRFWLIHKAKT